MLGISLYPDKTNFDEDKKYLELAHSLGYERVFMSMLQVDPQNPKKSLMRIRESIAYANELKMQVTLDIHPMVFQVIKKSEEDLSYFHEMGVHTLRLDSGYNGRVEAMMTHNPYHIHIELNVSNDNEYLSMIESYSPDKRYLSGSHNFYPQAYTGLPLDYFIKCSNRFHASSVKVAAFVTSQCADVSPWPVSEGLCTLEMHRHLPLDVQVRHLKMLGVVDDILIGNAYASEEELKRVAAIMNEANDVLQVVFNEDATDEEKELVNCLHQYRGDASEYVIRSSHNRRYAQDKHLCAHANVKDIHKGDILVLNEEYGQYKGEVQIALRDRSGDRRINVVGHIDENEMFLIDALKRYQSFVLKEK